MSSLFEFLRILFFYLNILFFLIPNFNPVYFNFAQKVCFFRQIIISGGVIVIILAFAPINKLFMNGIIGDLDVV